MSDVLVLKCDPDLADGLPGDRRRAALRASRARTLEVARGTWDPSSMAPNHGFGLLVLSGALCRRVVQNDCIGAELLGPGDLLRPWDRFGEISTLPVHSQWTVLQRTRLAVLDLGFAGRMGAFPEISANLAGRALQRSRYLAIISSIVSQRRVDRRLVMLFWHLADRFGQTRRSGIYIPLRLTHKVISELVGLRRPSVTSTLSRLQAQRVLLRQSDGWLLLDTRRPEELQPHDSGTRVTAALPIVGPVERPEDAPEAFPH